MGEAYFTDCGALNLFARQQQSEAPEMDKTAHGVPCGFAALPEPFQVTGIVRFHTGEPAEKVQPSLPTVKPMAHRSPY